MLVDMHVMAPPAGQSEAWARLLRACVGVGLDGVCLIASKALPPLDDARAALPRADLALFVGAEFSVGRGRLLLIPERPEEFANAVQGREVTSVEEALELARRTDSAVVAVHPYDRTPGTSFSDAIFHLEGLDAVEVVNATRSEVANRLALDATLRLHLAPVGGTGPATAPNTVGRAATVFTKALRDQAALVDALRRGEVFPIEMSRRPADRAGKRQGTDSSREGGA